MAQVPTPNLVQRAQWDIRTEKEHAIAGAQRWIARQIKSVLRNNPLATSAEVPLFVFWDHNAGLSEKDLPLLRAGLEQEGVEMTITKSCGFILCFFCHCCCDQRTMELSWTLE
jgi:hypothetical protein